MKTQVKLLLFLSIFLFIGVIQTISIILMRYFISNGILEVSPVIFLSIFGIILVLMGISSILTATQEYIIGINFMYSHIIAFIILTLLLIIAQLYLAPLSTTTLIKRVDGILIPTAFTCVVINISTFVVHIMYKKITRKKR